MVAGVDRVGLGWRPELAAGIFSNLHRIDAIEVIADDYLHCGESALRTLSAQVPIQLHSVGIGPASTVRSEQRRIDSLARLIERVRPECWSEHLAFVRGGGIEIGHLAAPPRNSATVDGAASNLDLLRKTVGSAPMVENIATLLDPPGSSMTEARWLRGVVESAGCDMLLDLHNVHANALNFGHDPVEFVRSMPADRIRTVHLSGGRMLPEGRLLDDHRHDPPDPVYALLEETAAHAAHPLTVILERDGRYPPIEQLLAQLDRARAAMAAGRARRSAR